jgi:thymidine kinase
MRKDHIEPVIPITGFTTWDDAIHRLFETEDKYQALCHLCHDEKTKQENMERKLLRSKDVVLKLDED